MAEQLALTVPTQNGEQPAERVQVRLLHRTDDPETSKRAARKVARSPRLGASLALFIKVMGRSALTVREAADLTSQPAHWFYEWDRRVKGWNVAGHIELTGEVRGGGRVWRVVGR